MSHLDMLGVEIAAGDFVVGSYNNMQSGIAIFSVERLTPKQVILKKCGAKSPLAVLRFYAKDLVKLSDDQTQKLLFKVIKGND